MQLDMLNLKAMTSLLALPFKFDQSLSYEHSVQHAAAWLLHAQKVNQDGGYAHSFHFLYGWERSYPETTGYIIPTLYDCADYFKNPLYKQSATEALNYILRVQQKDGSFVDLNGAKQVFDTGQILIGLNYVFEKLDKSEKNKNAMLAAARWLAEQQSADGSFEKHAYNSTSHAYYSRVGAAMMKSGELSGDEAIYAAGLKNINWTLSKQTQSGFFLESSFFGGEHPAYSHTIVYVLEGLLEAFVLTRSNKIQESILSSMDAIYNQLDVSGLVYSEYDSRFKVTDHSVCSTGLAQWARMCFMAANLFGQEKFIASGVKAIDFLKTNQYKASTNLFGGIPGSVPFYGKYMKNSIPNWGMKFYIDAVLTGCTLGYLTKRKST